MSKKDCDVVIVGAGASGLAAAWHLSFSNLNVIILEQGKKYNKNQYHKNHHPQIFVPRFDNCVFLP